MGLPSLRATLGVALALLVVGLLVAAGDLVGLVVLAATLAYLLLPLVAALERRGLGRTAAAAAVFVGLSLALVVLAWTAAPVAVRQAAELEREWMGGRLYALLDALERDLAVRFRFFEAGELGLAASARRSLEHPGNRLVGYVPDALSTASDAVVVPFVLFFLLRDGAALRKRLVGLVPNRYFEFVMGVLYKVDAHLGGYLRSQAVIALVIAALTALGLGALGVSNAVVLGAVAGLANFVPYVGLVASTLAAAVVSVVTTGGFEQVLGIVVLFAVVQMIENVALQPWITGRTVELHPVTVLLAILVGGRAFGILGMTLAVPAAAVLKVVVVETAVTLRRFRL